MQGSHGSGEAWSTRSESAARRLVGGRFHLVGRLGAGAAGTVWRAIDTTRGGEVALKLLHDAGSNATRLARFEREAELTRGLVHPGIVRVLEAGFLGQDLPFIAYELIEGAHTLGQVVPLASLRRRVELVRDVARAAGAAHAHGIVHRDLKLDNVLVDAAGQVRVADFGLAAAEGLERLTRTGAVVGTPLSMAPEQVRGGEVGPPTDVWALGVMLYQVLTGRSPFEGSSWDQLGAAIVAARPRAPRELAPELPLALEAVCLGALRAVPASRPADGEAFARQLDAWLLGEASTVSGSTVSGSTVSGLPRPGAAGWGRVRWLALVALLSLVPPALLLAQRWSVSTGPEDPRGSEPRPLPPSPPLDVAPPTTAAAPEPAPPAADVTPLGSRSLSELRALAEGGAPAAMHALGEALRDGREAPAAPEAAAEWFRRAAEAGHPAAMRALGLAFQAGRGVARDLDLAQAWLERAAEAGDAEAAADCGFLLEQERKDQPGAVQWYRRASEAGSARGTCYLGVMVEHGWGTRADPPAALELYARAAAAGYARAALWCAFCLEAGRTGVPADQAAAAQWYRQAAEGGDERGMRGWARALREGRGVPQDRAAAARWALRGAEAGDVECLAIAGDLLDEGLDGLPQDQARAEAYYRQAAERGSRAAMNNLGVALMRRGQPGEAVPWYRKSAEAGDSMAMKNLAGCLRDGSGTAQDLPGALLWFRRSVETGNALAMIGLGELLRDGRGTAADPAAALALFRRAAEAGNAAGMLQLGRLLRDGPTELRDAARARQWLERAAQAGSAEARRELDAAR